MTEPEPDWIVAARVLRPQGRRGEVLAEAEAAVELFTPGRTLWLASSTSLTTSGLPAPPTEARLLESAWSPTGRNAGRIVLKLSGTDSISSAEQLNGRLLLVPLEDLPPLAPDTFRVRDLIGCTLFNGDQAAGTVVEIQFPVAVDGKTRLPDAPDLLVIDPVPPAHSDPAADEDEDDDHLILVPFAQAWLQQVDIPGKRIVMHLPAGLLTDPAESDSDQ